MAESVAIDFVRISILENWRFWHSFGDNYEAAGREAIAQADALLAGDTANERAARLLDEASEFRAKKQKAGRKGGKTRVARERAARKKQNLEVLVKPTLPGTACGDAAAVTNNADTAPAGKLLDNGHRLPAKTRADAHAREDWDDAGEATTVRAQSLDGDAATREGAVDILIPQGEVPESGTVSADLQNRPGKSADSSVPPMCRENQGGSERGAGGTAIDAVRLSPGAGKRPEPPTLEELYAFASDACLHEMLCREWWEMTYGDRAGLDRDGRPIRNWKAACRAYVKKRISNMENEK